MEIRSAKNGLMFLLCFVLVCIPVVSANDNSITTATISEYRLMPENEVVHVTKQIVFTNTDPATSYMRGYYSSFNHYLPDNAENIKAWDRGSSLSVIKTDKGYHTFNFKNKVWYGEKYTFSFEYDIAINKNTAVFYITEQGDNTEVRLEVPAGFETHLARDDYELKDKQYYSLYTFQKGMEWDRSCLVNTVRQSENFVLTDVAHLQERDVKIEIQYWEGEEAWAQSMMETTKTSLPILESTWGMPFPPSYDIKIKQANITETGGYGGFNKGKAGIWMLHTSSNEILIHELAHYWTRACNFEQLWMDEGYADLYTYIVLYEIEPEKAVDRKERFFKKYESLKAEYDFPLSDWSIPQNLEKASGVQVDFGYKKAFVLAYDLYQDIGIENLKSGNLGFVASGSSVSEDMFINILSTSSGTDLSNIKTYIY